MPDATYDAIIVGGGNKGLALAMYLTKYGGMSVGVFEKKFEAGGGWCTDEGPAPGFLADYHATAVGVLHHPTLDRDFPEWVEWGGSRYNEVMGTGAIFKEDDSCIILYNRKIDRSQEKTMRSISSLSPRDAETWAGFQKKLGKLYMPAELEWCCTPPPPVDQPDAFDRLMANPESGFDPSWVVKSPLEVFRDCFESEAFCSFLGRLNMSNLGIAPDCVGTGAISLLLCLSWLAPRTAGLEGGTHSYAHVAVKIILANGGKIYTEREVDRVIIENGKATGVKLSDGSEVKARQAVISTLDPYNLCFRLIGREHLPWRLARRVEGIERRMTCLMWYTWALHEQPDYVAAQKEPDINKIFCLSLTTKDPEGIVRERALRMLGKNPDELELTIINHSLTDKTRKPEGKACLMTEQFVVPADALTEKEWIDYKKKHSQQVIDIMQKHTRNMSWDKVIGCATISPYDICHNLNMAPTGNWAVIDNTGSQIGKYRPVPELARHRTPIKNLYATGSAWHPWGFAGSYQSYNCYKIMAEDLGLRKPWEEKNLPY